MKVLIQAYKKAIIEGDEKNAQEIQALICVLESGKESLSKKLTEIINEKLLAKMCKKFRL